MFDIKKYINTQSRLNEIEEKITELKKLESELYQKQFEIKCVCTHDLILVYDVSYYYSEGNRIEDYRHGVCLICDDTFKLKCSFFIGDGKVSKIYKKFGSNEEINNDSIIDITSYIPEEFRNYWIKNKNELVIVAQKILNELDNNEISLAEVKAMIKEGLIKYTKDRDKELNGVVKKELKRNDDDE